MQAPQLMDIAIDVGVQYGIAFCEDEVRLELAFLAQVPILKTLVGLHEYHGDMMDVDHRMAVAHRDGDEVPITTGNNSSHRQSRP